MGLSISAARELFDRGEITKAKYLAAVASAQEDAIRARGARVASSGRVVRVLAPEDSGGEPSLSERLSAGLQTTAIGIEESILPGRTGRRQGVPEDRDAEDRRSRAAIIALRKIELPVNIIYG